MSEAVQIPDNFQYLKPAQIEELSRESSNLEAKIRDPRPGGADKGEMQRRRRQIERMLSEQSPPDLSAGERDAYAKEAAKLEAQFSEGMPSAQEMRRNPPGAVDKHMAWERRNKRAISRWKNIMRALHKGDDSPNLCNIERFRRHATPADLSMAGAQIEGKVFSLPSDQFRENYDQVFGSTTDAPAEDAMPCGRVVDPRGRLAHARACAVCRESLGEAD